ncbi:MAG: glycoside hydrolase family 32 protein [Bacteroidota bacterium]
MDRIAVIFALLGLTFTLGCNTTTSTTPPMSATIHPRYTEPHRPQFHFSPDSMWMNDPNGMVYYDGVYHLFYQFYPDSTVWGPMHWGHATSKDLVHWEHLPIALYPDSLGLIFSGSAVVDWKNTAGFKSGEKDPLVAMYTYHLMEGEKAGRTDFQYQGIAYSTDGGISWDKYEGNPVIPNSGVKDFRDPKMFWHEASNQWVMILAAKDRVQLFNSPDLKNWTLASEFGANEGSHSGVWECPDLFELPVIGGTGTKWMMIVSLGDGGPNGGSCTQYFIGDFDGKTFVNDHSPETILWLDDGRDNYAGVTWSDVPESDSRKIFLGWMSNWKYAQVVPTETWRSAMTVPRKLELVETRQGVRLKTLPVRELEQLRKEALVIEQPGAEDQQVVIPLTEGLGELKLDLRTEASFTIQLKNSKGESVQFLYDASLNQYAIDRANAGKVDFESSFPDTQVIPRKGKWASHSFHVFVDHSSMEVFAEGGLTVATSLFFPTENFHELVIGTEGEVAFEKVECYPLRSIWSK